MKKLYIYVLKCPKGNIRYVGKTNNLKKRLYSHINEAKKGKGRRYVLNWIHSLLLLNLKPSIEVIEECDANNWQDREKYWVEYYRKLIPNLCNNADGGLGGSGVKNFTKEELNKRKQTMSNTFSKFNSEEKIDIWNLIQEGKTLKEISIIYPNYNRHIDFGVRNGRQWKNITKLNYINNNSKRKGYTCRNGLYMIRRKINGIYKIAFSSRNEKEIITWLEDEQ